GVVVRCRWRTDVGTLGCEGLERVEEDGFGGAAVDGGEDALWIVGPNERAIAPDQIEAAIWGSVVGLHRPQDALVGVAIFVVRLGQVVPGADGIVSGSRGGGPAAAVHAGQRRMGGEDDGAVELERDGAKGRYELAGLPTTILVASEKVVEAVEHNKACRVVHGRIDHLLVKVGENGLSV